MDPIINLLDDMVYENYRANRDSCPNIKPESWRFPYGAEADALEARYQAEKALAKAAA